MGIQPFHICRGLALFWDPTHAHKLLSASTESCRDIIQLVPCSLVGNSSRLPYVYLHIYIYMYIYIYLSLSLYLSLPHIYIYTHKYVHIKIYNSPIPQRLQIKSAPIWNIPQREGHVMDSGTRLQESWSPGSLPG